jgi:hypothetical protein
LVCPRRAGGRDRSARSGGGGVMRFWPARRQRLQAGSRGRPCRALEMRTVWRSALGSHLWSRHADPRAAPLGSQGFLARVALKRADSETGSRCCWRGNGERVWARTMTGPRVPGRPVAHGLRPRALPRALGRGQVRCSCLPCRPSFR